MLFRVVFIEVYQRISGTCCPDHQGDDTVLFVDNSVRFAPVSIGRAQNLVSTVMVKGKFPSPVENRTLANGQPVPNISVSILKRQSFSVSDPWRCDSTYAFILDLGIR